MGLEGAWHEEMQRRAKVHFVREEEDGQGETCHWIVGVPCGERDEKSMRSCKTTLNWDTGEGLPQIKPPRTRTI
jgi:hypothetical protein